MKERSDMVASADDQRNKRRQYDISGFLTVFIVIVQNQRGIDHQKMQERNIVAGAAEPVESLNGTDHAVDEESEQDAGRKQRFEVDLENIEKGPDEIILAQQHRQHDRQGTGEVVLFPQIGPRLQRLKETRHIQAVPRPVEAHIGFPGGSDHRKQTVFSPFDHADHLNGEVVVIRAWSAVETDKDIRDKGSGQDQNADQPVVLFKHIHRNCIASETTSLYVILGNSPEEERETTAVFDSKQQ